jgi:hypothetical protein
MARAFTTNQQINGTTTVAKNLSYFSMAAWIRRPTSGTQQMLGFAEDGTHWLGINHLSDNVLYFINSNGSAFAYGAVSMNTQGWGHAAFTFDGTQSTNATRLKGFFNGTQRTLTFLGTQSATTSNNAALETFRIGRRTVSGLWSDGDFAEIGMWQAALTAAEIASLANGMTCDKVRPQSLIYYSPLVREIQDLAQGMTLTNTDSTVANHPRVYA